MKTIRVRSAVVLFVLLVVLATGAPVAGAADIAVHINRHRPNTTTSQAVIGTIVAHSVNDSVPPREFAGRDGSISLPPGDWFLSARFADDWSEDRLVTVGGGAEQQTIELDTYPLARLAARVTLADGRTPRELRAYFHRVQIAAVNAPPEGNVSCTVSKGAATCALPAGDYDVAFRIHGYATRYCWNKLLAADGRAVDVGTLRFVPGATLSGRVEVAQPRKALLDHVSVSVQPAAIPGANDDQRHRAESARITVHPTLKGFFAVDLPAGEFTVQASLGDLISEERRVDIAAGSEAMLRQPLQLEPQRTVTVRVHPPVNPWSTPWTVEFAEVDPTGVVLSERAMKTSADGSCRFGNVLPGTHRLNIVRANNQSWATRMLDVEQDQTLDIDVHVVRLTGTIRLGSKPLAAVATLRSKDQGASVFFASKADGTFAARLPEPDHDMWDQIEVRADSPQVKRVLDHVRFQMHDDGTAEMNLDLPSRSITGSVVDERGRPATRALIDVVSPNGSIQQIGSEDGTFSAVGLEPGRYVLRAATRERESDNRTETTLSDDDDATADVVITVSPVGHLRGVVQSLDGPVLGAALFATVPGDETRPLILSRVDQDGRFDIRFPSGTAEVAVAINAPGFAFRLMRIPLLDEDETFAVDQNIGTLSVDVPALKSGLRPYLLHGGASLPAGAVGYLAGATFAANLSERVKFEIPSAEPGPYSLCWYGILQASRSSTRAPECVSGVLAPHGTLTLGE
jgi:hypothetical protein